MGQKDFAGSYGRSPLSRAMWFVLGTFCLCVGAIGVVVPLLPTTPLLLVAAYCYLRSSKRMYAWMTTNRVFGQYLCSYREGRGLPVRVKVITVAILWCTLGVSSYVYRDSIWVVMILVLVGVAVTAHVASIRPRRTR